MRHGTCTDCGVQFAYEYKGGRLRRYCDDHKRNQRAKKPIQPPCGCCGGVVEPKLRNYRSFCDACSHVNLARRPKGRARTCVVCSAQWCNVRGGRRTKTCSPECALEHNRRSAAARHLAAPATQKTCVICGAPFSTKQPNQVVCGSACRTKRRNALSSEAARRRPSRPASARRVIGFRSCSCCGCLMSLRNHPSDRVRKFCSRACVTARCVPLLSPKKRRSGPVLKGCSWCGKAFVGRTGTCSNDCRSFNDRYLHPKWLNHKRIYLKQCPWCAKLHYVTRKKSRSSCSDECAQLVIDALGTDGKWSWITRERRWSIYARDQYICQICMEPALMEQAGTAHPFAPSLDHVLPRSHGGGHEDANLRLAHFICNSQRGNRAFEQLELAVA